MNFGKLFLNTKYVFSFSLQLLSETFHILKRTDPDAIINVNMSPRKAPDILVTF